jgi:hypothetical protein
MTSRLSRWTTLRSASSARGAWKLSGLAGAIAITSLLGAVGFATSSVVVAPSAQAAELRCLKRLGREGNYLVCCPKYFPSPDCVVIKLPSRLSKSAAFPRAGQKLMIPIPSGGPVYNAPACPGGGTQKCTLKCTGLFPPKCEYVEPCTCTLDNAATATEAYLTRNPDTTKPPPRGPRGGVGSPANILETGPSMPTLPPSPTGTPAPPKAPPPAPPGGQIK